MHRCIPFAALACLLAGTLAISSFGSDPATPPPPPRATAPVVGDGVTIGGKTEVEPYKVVRLEAVGVGPLSGVLWNITPLDAANAGLVDYAGGGDLSGPVLEWVAPPGKYLADLTVVTVETGKRPTLARVSKVVTVGKPTPPPPPVPADPLAGEFRQLYQADASPTKLPDMMALAELYKMMVAESGKPEYATPLALNARFQMAASDMLKERLKATVRSRAAREIESLVGGEPNDPLTPAVRQALAATYARLARCVEEAIK